MNIIFNQQLAKELKEKYTILELDTILQPGMTEPLTLYAVIEKIDISEISTLEFFKAMHESMVESYKSSNWEQAAQLALGLVGQWHSELDEFYNLVIDFSTESAKVNRSWDGIKHTVPKE
jgi:hypothetical protein